MNKFRNLYIEYMEGMTGVPDLPNKKAEIVELLKGANIRSRSFYMAENDGYGCVRRMTVDSFDNLFYVSVESVPYNIQAMAEAKEVYRRRMINSINPFFWLMSIVFLPRTILIYLGASTENTSSKILNIIYWILVPLLIEPVRNYIVETIHNLFGL